MTDLSRTEFKALCFDLINDYSYQINQISVICNVLSELELKLYGEKGDEANG